MITVTSRKDLKLQDADYILVAREDIMYKRVDAEYIQVRYFTTQQAKDILKLDTIYQVYALIAILGIQAKANKRRAIKITLQQLRMMVELQTKIEDNENKNLTISRR